MSRQHAFLEAVRRSFPDAPAISDAGEDVFEIVWTKDSQVSAGVTAFEDAYSVFLDCGHYEVEDPNGAVAVLRAIFADELVAVGAFSKGMAVCSALARPDALMAGISSLDRSKSSVEVPVIDLLVVRSWSGELDQGEPPVIDPDDFA